MDSFKPTLTTLPLEIQSQILLSLPTFKDHLSASASCRIWQQLYHSDPLLRRTRPRYRSSDHKGVPDIHRLIGSKGAFRCTINPDTGTIVGYQLFHLGHNRRYHRLQDISLFACLDDPLFAPLEALSPDSQPLSDLKGFELPTTLHVYDEINYSGIWQADFKVDTSLTLRGFVELVAAKSHLALQFWNADMLLRGFTTKRISDTVELEFCYELDNTKGWALDLIADLTAD
ncbi:hypothetical protein ABW21_db0206942 [Orbilia brochopaga]|nr:hypothetical protein ABW21_db0206942 [Drechslerella brochopaga]